MWPTFALLLYSIELILFTLCHQISWENRKQGDKGYAARVTVDGTDMPVQHHFDPKFMSHKFKSNGLKYEVGVCILSGNIVWLHGPFRGGESDIEIIRSAMLDALDKNEMVEADGGYRGEEFYIKCPNDASSSEQRYMKTVARSRHETANERFKIFDILRTKFRHPLEKHSMCFRTIAVITQLNIEHGSPLYSVEYVDDAKLDEIWQEHA